MNYDHFVRSNTTIHKARTITRGPRKGFIVTKCGRLYSRANAGVYTVQEFMNLPAVRRHLPDCCHCHTRRWPEVARKAGE